MREIAGCHNPHITMSQVYGCTDLLGKAHRARVILLSHHDRCNPCPRKPVLDERHLHFERMFVGVGRVARAHLRQVGEATDQLRQDAIAQDLSFRNRLIEIFGTPYEGTIGTGKPYPAGYSGPDLSLYMYVDVRGVTSETVRPPNAASRSARMRAASSVVM